MSHQARSMTVVAATLALLGTLVLLGPAVGGAATFGSLPPGEQKIVRALYEAQPPASATFKPLTLDQIAAKRGGAKGGWGRVFKDMKTGGYVSQKNLGAVVSDYEHRHSPSKDAGVKGAAAPDDVAKGNSASASAGGMGHGGGHGGGRGR